MNIYDILRKKRLNKYLSFEEIEFLVSNYYNGNIPDYQMASFLTSCAINGMSKEELFYFTKAIVQSGSIMDFSDIDGIKIDKHSTGGVGDSVSLIVIPILASLSYKVPKLSGRALGHTGGTIDKLESIPNFRTNLSIDEMKEALRKVGAFICQASNLAPADKKIYALRDVTANVDSIPLIASSIMSKKIASNSDVIILDVKVGGGAFMNDYPDALELSKTMIDISKSFNKKCGVVISDMDEPLNSYIGNYLEIMSVIDFLKGNFDKYPKLKKVCFSVLNLAYSLVNGDSSLKDNSSIFEKLIINGDVLLKFKGIIEFQGGDSRLINDPYRYFEPKLEYSLYSKGKGYIYFDTYYIGLAAGELGLSRKKIDDQIDNSAGIIMNVRKGDFVNENQLIMKLFAKDNQSLEDAVSILEKAIMFSNTPLEVKDVYDVLV
jgi:pyrimidine-nucleoside phosphorylase